MKVSNIVFLSLFFLFIIIACIHEEIEMDTWNVTVKVHNNSGYDVTDILIWGFYKPNITKLENGSVETLSLEWEEFKNTKIGKRIQIEYNINGKRFYVENQEDAVWYKRLPLGHLEWVEDGVRFEVELAGEYDQGEDEGWFTSLQHFTNHAKIDIFIDNESYRIEGGVFQKISIPLLPPWLRDDYPESYFEFNRPPQR